MVFILSEGEIFILSLLRAREDDLNNYSHAIYIHNLITTYPST